MSMPGDRFIGLMSGTSLDGVDGVLVDFAQTPLQVQAFASLPFPASLAGEFLALNEPGGINELHRAALAANALARLYASVVAQLLQRSGLAAQDVRAIGAHGQTVRHQPQQHDGMGYTLQLNNPALLAELSGISTVADFRSRDLAAGGQGAPLVPAFHQAVFGQRAAAVAVLNLGGMSNLTLLRVPPAPVLGFDCGPGNVLLDHWCRAHKDAPFDAKGAWASQGRAIPALLSRMLEDPFFAKAPPKSTGRDHFHPAWLLRHLEGQDYAPVDVQATLSELSAAACADALQRHGADCRRLVVCGGGAFNQDLLARLRRRLPDVEVVDSGAEGLPPLQVEAAAFAWLARATLRGEPGSLPSVTGASAPRVLGAIYPA